MRLEITRKTDLATRALLHLAGQSGRIKSPALAEAVGTTPGFLSQVMTPIVAAGWARSDPGPTGGYSLTVDLANVSVLEVIEAIEGTTDTERCVLQDRPCASQGHCALHRPWAVARTNLLNELRATSIDSLRARPTR